MNDDVLTCLYCDAPLRVSWRGTVLTRCQCALAAAASGGDVKQAPGEAPQSGHEVATPSPSHIPLMNKDTNRG